MDGKIKVTELQLSNLKRAVNINNLKIVFTGYTRLQPQNRKGYSEAEVSFTYNDAADVFNMGLFFGKETEPYQFGTIEINFP